MNPNGRRRSAPARAAALAAALAAPAQCLDADAPPPNVIVIMTDDQGYGDLRCHGNPVISTPNLDRLAGESASLADFHVDAYCTPTRSALMTGRYSHRVGGWGTIAGRNMLRDGELTMAEVFRHNGYRTGLFGKWHLGTNHPYRPIDLGFDEWLGKGDGGTGCTTDHWGNDRVDDTFIRNGEPVAIPGYETDVFFDAAIDFIRADPRRPFFVYLPPYAPHSPWSLPDPAWRDPYLAGCPPKLADFYASITRIDRNIGRLRGFLSSRGLAANTLLVFLTDNGSSGRGFNAGMRGYKGSQYEGGHRVPCLLHWPAGGLTGGRVGRLTAHLDLLPTFVDLCSLELPRPVRFDGTSLRPLLADPTRTDWPARTLVMASVFNEMPIDRPMWTRSTVMRDRWRLVDGRELYDLSADPGQQSDRSAEYPQVVAELRTAYENYRREMDTATRDWRTTLGRPLAGTTAQPELFLCSEDWVTSGLAQCPWNQAHVSSGKRAFGSWRIRVATAGSYRLEIRRWPRETDAPLAGVPTPAGKPADAWLAGRPLDNLLYGGTPAALPIAAVQVSTATRTTQSPLDPSAPAAVVHLDLPAGEVTLDARFLDPDGNPVTGAYYLYLRLQPPPPPAD